MATVQAQAQQEESPWKGADVATLFFGFIPVTSIAAIWGGWAASLNIVGSSLVCCSPLIMLLVAFVCPAILFNTRWSRMRHGITMALVLACAASAPCLVGLASKTIPLSRELEFAELTGLKQRFPIPMVLHIESRNTELLRIRRWDDSPELREHLANLGVVAKNL